MPERSWTIISREHSRRSEPEKGASRSSQSPRTFSVGCAPRTRRPGSRRECGFAAWGLLAGGGTIPATNALRSWDASGTSPCAPVGETGSVSHPRMSRKGLYTWEEDSPKHAMRSLRGSSFREDHVLGAAVRCPGEIWEWDSG